ncbi:MAG: glutamate--tRNA ligase, partial [Candidatus Magasanikbacteria bacterium]|nr:glutamate--tRNA ligase [Candidatus Magasanikbacteria bacterium]
MVKIRVRFAPSPTGYLHIGSLRTALFNYLFARQKGGDFILRIEDTDQTRYVAGAVEQLIAALNQMGLAYDEGPILKNGKITEKGDWGPYFQSQRTAFYQKYADKLIESGRAYYCFCAAERLEKLRQTQQLNKQPTIYDGSCRRLSAADCQKKIRDKVPYVIRLKVPKKGKTKFHDLIRGEVEFENKLIDDQIILKSDGFPTYHLANVVDDCLMKISHVIRGEEWLPSMPKHILLYQAFGWEPPRFAHLPLLLNPDKSKLSKRQGDVAVEDYLKKGYLPEALLNFVALLGWNPGTEREIFNLKELVEIFDLARVQKAGAIFNLQKLDWLNAQFIKKKTLKELVKISLPFLKKAGLIKKSGEEMEKIEKIAVLERARLNRLSDLPELAKFFFQ